MPQIDLFFVIEDAKGDKSRVTLPASIGALADIQYAVQEVGLLIDAIVDGGIVSAGATVIADVSALNNVPALTSDVQEGARFVWNTVTTALGSYLKSVRIPTVLESIFNSGDSSVDLSNADVLALTTAVVDGVDLTGAGGSSIITFTDSRGLDLVSLDAANEDWGKNR